LRGRCETDWHIRSRCDAGRITRASENVSDVIFVVGISHSLNAAGDDHQIFVVDVSVAPEPSRELILKKFDVLLNRKVVQPFMQEGLSNSLVKGQNARKTLTSSIAAGSFPEDSFTMFMKR
jgi:hypothetical protein